MACCSPVACIICTLRQAGGGNLVGPNTWGVGAASGPAWLQTQRAPIKTCQMETKIGMLLTNSMYNMHIASGGGRGAWGLVGLDTWGVASASGPAWLQTQSAPIKTCLMDMKLDMLLTRCMYTMQIASGRGRGVVILLVLTPGVWEQPLRLLGCKRGVHQSRLA